MKIVFMGTPDFARDSLSAIYDAGHEIPAVVTVPDKPKGRGMKLIPCEVKEYAVEKNIKVYQPEKLRGNKEIVDILKDINPDVICVVAYGKIIPKEILEIPKYGCVNVHPSLLPQYRGSAPIQWAILNGDKETGVTTMYLDEGMDSGDIILQTKTPIDKDETSGELWDRLSKIGAELLVETLEKIENKILKDNKDNLEWLEITREGTKYIVRVEERIINNKPKDNKIYNIVASKNAVIKNIYAESGEKVRSINTYVKKGDIIISSDITLPNNEKISKTASGKVQGEVWYSINIEYPYQYHEIKYTGNKKKVLVLNLLNKRISFFDFHKYKTFNRNIKYIFNNNITPISLIYEDEYETNIINEIYDYNTAREKAITKAKKKLLEKYSNIEEVTNVKIINEEDKETKISLSLFVTCLEDITEYQEVVDNSQ